MQRDEKIGIEDYDEYEEKIQERFRRQPQYYDHGYYGGERQLPPGAPRSGKDIDAAPVQPQKRSAIDNYDYNTLYGDYNDYKAEERRNLDRGMSKVLTNL